MPSLADVVPGFLALVLSLSFHEAAHAWTSNRLGDPTARLLGRLTLNPLVHVDWIGTVLFPLIAMWSGLPLIGWAKPVPVNGHNLAHPRRDFAIVALAGPISNLILATAAAVVRAIVLNTNTSMESTAPLPSFLLTFVALNVLLAVFNLIPVPPLDGGNVLLGVLPAEGARLYERIRPWGFLILYALMLSGLLWEITWPINRAILDWLL